MLHRSTHDKDLWVAAAHLFICKKKKKIKCSEMVAVMVGVVVGGGYPEIKQKCEKTRHCPSEK